MENYTCAFNCKISSYFVILLSYFVYQNVSEFIIVPRLRVKLKWAISIEPCVIDAVNQLCKPYRTDIYVYYYYYYYYMFCVVSLVTEYLH